MGYQTVRLESLKVLSPAHTLYRSLGFVEIPLPVFMLGLQATCAFASREGEALVQPVRWIIVSVLITFAALVIGGGFLGAFRASQSGESILKGVARGLLKGIVTFLVVVAVSVGLVTVLGILWVAYSLLHVYVLNPS